MNYYLRQTFALGPDTDADEDDLNQLGGLRPKRYFAVNLGKFSTADFFDQNSYSHDPRTQFLKSLMSADAWDYAANTRGYTVGGVLEYVTPDFALRFGSTVMPTYANGPVLDFHYGTARAETLELADQRLPPGWSPGHGAGAGLPQRGRDGQLSERGGSGPGYRQAARCSKRASRWPHPSSASA